MAAETVTIAILAKDKTHCLPLYLNCILAQTFPKDRTYLYIRTNDNTDATSDILDQWVKEYRHLYKEVYFETGSIHPDLTKYKPHQWNTFRFSILGKIRQESVEWSQEKESHYFVADCDNFIHPQTIDILLSTRLPVIGPFLVTGKNLYSNYHHRVDQRGYFLFDNEYRIIYDQKVVGLLAVDVIHCTYLLRKDILKKVSYLEDTSIPEQERRHEYVVFSENLRKNNIQQYLDNRHVYGRITFADNIEEFSKESWLNEFNVK